MITVCIARLSCLQPLIHKFPDIVNFNVSIPCQVSGHITRVPFDVDGQTGRYSRGDALPRNGLEILVRAGIGAVLRDKDSLREARAERGAGNCNPVGITYLINPQGAISNNPKIHQVLVVSIAAIDSEGVRQGVSGTAFPLA